MANSNTESFGEHYMDITTLALVPASQFGGFFILPTAVEFSEQTGFLQLPFQPTERPADMLKVWPHREPVRRIRSDEFQPDGRGARSRPLSLITWV